MIQVHGEGTFWTRAEFLIPISLQHDILRHIHSVRSNNLSIKFYGLRQFPNKRNRKYEFVVLAQFHDKTNRLDNFRC